MDCERFDKIALSLLYEEADELSTASARRHLHHCSRCQNIFNQLRATREVTDIPLEAPPDGLFESVLEAERRAQAELPIGERLSRMVSIMAGYAMRPQLAMAAILLLMIGSSLLFVRSDPSGRDQVRVTELGAPHRSPPPAHNRAEPEVFPGESTERALEAAPAAAQGPKATYEDALTAYHEGRYAEAERLFSEVAEAGGEKAASAALHEGHAARNGSGCQRASGLYDQIAERYRGTTISDEASWHAASCYQAMGQAARARAHYQGLEDSAAFGERATKALAAMRERELELAEQAAPASEVASSETSSSDPSNGLGTVAQRSGGAAEEDAKAGVTEPTPPADAPTSIQAAAKKAPASPSPASKPASNPAP